MFKHLVYRLRAAVCMVLLAFSAGLPLVSPPAHAGSIPLAGEFFYEAEGTLYPYIGLLPGWSWHQYSVYFTKVFMTSDPADNALGIYDYVTMICALQCDPSDPNYLSRQVDGLVTGHQYKLSFWAKGYWQDDIGEGFPDSFTYGNTKVSASVGSYKSPDIEILNGTAWNWQKVELNFTYKDASPSALLSIIQNIVGPMTLGCMPCGTTLWFGGIALDDVTPAAPKLTVTKALGGNRIANTDQFTVQILEGIRVVNSTSNSTTTGSGATVDSGSGTTGVTSLIAGTSYLVKEVASGTTNLGRYKATLACSNASGTTVPTALNTPFTLADTDNVTCTLSNSRAPAVLAVRQMVQSTLALTQPPPYSFSYTASNGWGTHTLTNTAVNSFSPSFTQDLAALDTASTLAVTLPSINWAVSSLSCVDTNAAVSGNPSGTLVSTLASSVTLAASYVRPGANLLCTSVLRYRNVR